MAGKRITHYDIPRTDNPATYRNFENLAIAIVKTATDEYRKAVVTGEKRTIFEIERFFNSNLGDLCCFGDGEMVLQLLKEDIEKGKSARRTQASTKM